jgi:formate dehydrogenase major subunit/formate dehydrogenase alpha subunit
MDDWMILAKIGTRMGLRMPYHSAESVMAEITSVSPLYAGLTYEDIERGTDLWPYKGKPLRHTTLKDLELEKVYRKPRAPERKPLHLAVEKPLFHSGTMSRASSALNGICPEPVVRLNRDTAGRFGVEDGGKATVLSSKGNITLKVKIDEVPESVLYMTNNFRDKGVMALMEYHLEPMTKAPVPEGNDVLIRKVGP